jgi:hypothetical protein
MALPDRLFQTDTSTFNHQRKRLHAAYELALTLLGFGAALLFLVGSVLFFDEALERPAIWCFVIGSLFFLPDPTVKLIRELHYARLGDVDELAQKIET